MAAARVKQQGQQAFAFKTWGGKRKGAGRPAKGRRASEPHKRRLRFDKPRAVHATLRVVDELPALRRRRFYAAIRKAAAAVLDRTHFRIVHLSIEDDHVHLIVEADNNDALSKGVQAFESSAAQRINRAIGDQRGTPRRRGPVFADRYHERFIGSPTQARRTIAYVLNNWRRHRRDGGMETMFWDVDYFSSGPSFSGWRELEQGYVFDEVPETYVPIPVARPQTWLLAVGWRKAGSISLREVPGPR